MIRVVLATMLVSLLWALGPCLAGCILFDSHAKQMDLMAGMATDAATRLKDGSIGQFQVSGQALNPGIVVEASMVYRATARYDGLAGQFGASGQGEFGKRSSDVGPILDIITNANVTNEQRRALLGMVADRMLPTTQPVQP